MLTKVLEKKWVIRLFGLALMLSPFLNVIISGEAVMAPGQHMTWHLFWEFCQGVPLPFKILEIASFAIGALMLRGSVTAWRFLLALLGGYIVLQFVHLGQNVRTDKTAWVFIAVNILVFFFIADQLVLKPQTPIQDDGGAEATAAAQADRTTVFVPTTLGAVTESDAATAAVAAPVSTPVAPTLNIVQASGPRVSRKNIVIDLNGFGKWAKLIDISPEGLRVRCMSELPQGMASRRLAVSLGGVDLQLRFARQLDQDVVFGWENLSQTQVHSLNNWIRAISA